MRKTARILATFLAVIFLFGNLSMALASPSVTVSLTAYVDGIEVPAGEGGNLASGDSVTIIATVTGASAGATYTWTRTSTGGSNAGIPQPVNCTTNTCTFILERGQTSGNYVCVVTVDGGQYTSPELRISTASGSTATTTAAAPGTPPPAAAPGAGGISVVISSDIAAPVENDNVTLTATVNGADAAGATYVWSRLEIGGPNVGQTVKLDSVTNTTAFSLTPMTSGDYYCIVTLGGTEYVSNTLTVSMISAGGSNSDPSTDAGKVPDASTATPLGINGTVTTNGSRILFTSDIHMTEANLPTLMNVVGSVGLVAFGGDYSGGMTNHLEPDVIHALKNTANANGAEAIFAAGNHEAAVSNDDWERFSGMPRVGLGAVEAGGKYEVFLFSAAASSQEFNEVDITALSAYLDTVDAAKPIFVVSHFPLHYYNERRNSGAADQVIDLLNEHPNVIFLWGHNHTEGDPKYGTTAVAGDTIQWGAEESDSKQINFTYANMGCLRDGANLNAYGVVADVQGDTVSLCYYDLNGVTSQVTTVTMPKTANLPTDLITSAAPSASTVTVSSSLNPTAEPSGAGAAVPTTGVVVGTASGNLPQTGTNVESSAAVTLLGIGALMSAISAVYLMNRKKQQ